MKRRRFLFIHIGQFRLIVRKSVVLGMFIAALALLVFSKSDSPLIRTARSSVSSTLSPVLQAVRYPFELIGSGYDAVVDVFQVYRQNKTLKAENAEVLMLKTKIKTLKAENERLGALLNYTPPADARFVTAKVIAVEGDGFSHSLIVYVNDAQDVKAGQVVLGDKGVVGRVENVGRHYARVILLTDINSKIPVIVGKGRTRGLLSGDNTSLPKLIYTALDADIKSGDEILTSGVSGFFPSDLPVGKVIGVRNGQIEIDVFSDIETLEYVRIVDYGLPGLIVEQIAQEDL